MLKEEDLPKLFCVEYDKVVFAKNTLSRIIKESLKLKISNIPTGLELNGSIANNNKKYFKSIFDLLMFILPYENKVSTVYMLTLNEYQEIINASDNQRNKTLNNILQTNSFPSQNNEFGAFYVGDVSQNTKIPATRKFNLKSFEYWDLLVKLEAMSLHNLNIIDFQGYLGGLAFQGIDRGEGSQNFGAFKEKLKTIRETVMNAFAKKRNNQIISIENGGKFEFTEINNNHMDMGYTIIAQQKSALTGFPITWLLGRSPQGFNSTGKSEENQVYEASLMFLEEKVLPILNNVAEFLQGIDAIKPQVIDIPEKTRENLKLSTLLPVLEAHLSEQEYQTIKDNILGDFIKEKDVTSNIS